MRVGLVDPIVASVCGPIPFQGPYAIGHECVAEVLETGPSVSGLQRGDLVIVPWAVSCGSCSECERGLTAKCATTRVRRPHVGAAARGGGSAAGRGRERQSRRRVAMWRPCCVSGPAAGC
ncbi:alcohol dehydrogenase catalytic domain-containing protein [Mycobacterium sp. NPDC048908]|uniref:alcohol dehydrogenase catalytic domain-containing protein n=1 Tax=Mycobacterium sp. NPDC048908 TaxID=3364292 RepID=UPI00371414D9